MEEIKKIIKAINYKNWVLEFKNKEEIIYASIIPKNESNAEIDQISNFESKWFLQEEMSFYEVINQCFLGISTIERNILKHDFFYKDINVFLNREKDNSSVENETVYAHEHKPISSLENIKEVIGDVKYKDWEFRVTEKGNLTILQLWFYEKDTDTGELIEQYSRQWILNINMGITEIVNTCFLAVSTAIRHEIRENFFYENKRVSNPHRDIEKIVHYRKGYAVN